MAIYLQDNFTDTDGTNLTAHTMDTGSGWTSLLGTWTVQSNAAKLTTNGGGTEQNAIVADAGVADVVVYATILDENVANGVDAGIICNAVDANNYWLLQWSNTGSWVLYEHVSGGFTSRASGTFSYPGTGLTFIPKLITSGDSISVYFDGTLKSTYTVGSRPLKTATKCGLRTFQTKYAIFQDFQVSSSASFIPPPYYFLKHVAGVAN